jgi:DNA polymerase III subunit delta
MSIDTKPPIHLFTGEAVLVRRHVDRLVSALLPEGCSSMNYSHFDAEEAEDEPLTQARTISMFTARRVVYITGFERSKAPLLQRLVEYAKAPNPSSVVIIVGQKLPPASGGANWGSRLSNAVKKIGVVRKFDPKSLPPTSFLREEAKVLGKQLDGRAASLMVRRVGEDLQTLQNELLKLICYVGEAERISESDIVATCSSSAEAVIWDLTDSIVKKDSDQAMACLHRLLEEGKKSHQLFSMICWQIRQLIELQDHLRRGGPRPKGLRMPERKRQAAIRILKKTPLDSPRILSELVAANRGFNSARSGDRRQLEGLVIRLCS